ncbi:MAG: transposase [Candidatus Methanoperedens sp.]
MGDSHEFFELVRKGYKYKRIKQISPERGNMTSYAKNVKGSNNQKFQHFISDSQWDTEPIIDQIQEDVTDLIGNKINGSIHIDESGFKKYGKDSVGVKRQYLVRLGKVEKTRSGGINVEFLKMGNSHCCYRN